MKALCTHPHCAGLSLRSCMMLDPATLMLMRSRKVTMPSITSITSITFFDWKVKVWCAFSSFMADSYKLP